MILGTEQIRQHLIEGRIFRQGTWCDDHIKEASYALRVACDGMVLDGKVFSPGSPYQAPGIEIKPGRIAILSTEERLCMPPDLVGKLGVRLDFASRGLTGLMGIQVDPYYGEDSPDERLYIKVANFGNETVTVRPGDPVFNIEFSMVSQATKPEPRKRPTWDRLIEELVHQEHSDWTFLARVQTDLGSRANDLEQQMSNDIGVVRTQQRHELSGIRNNQQSVVMFGVFLVAITILSVAIGVVLNVKGAPSWITHGGWIFLLVLCGIATVAIGAFLVFASWAFWMSTRAHHSEQRERSVTSGSMRTESDEPR